MMTHNNQILCGFTNVNWARNYKKCKLTFGYMRKLGLGPITCCSQKQLIVALSSTKVKYRMLVSQKCQNNNMVANFPKINWSN